MSPRFGVSNHSNFLSEITRRNLVGKTKVQSPQRYVKRLGYKPLSYNGIDIQNLLDTGECVLKVPVGKYTVTIAYQGVLDKLVDVLQRQPRPNVTLQSVIRALTQAIDDTDVLVDCTCADFCLHADTKIKLLNGETISVKDMEERFKSGEELWVYSTDEHGDFKPGRVEDVWISGTTHEYIEVTLDNGESIVTTPNHPYMCRDGSYRRADELCVGQSLMPLYFSYHNGYENVKVNSEKTTQFRSVYKVVANELLKDKIEAAKVRSGESSISIHHSDFNKLNNYPSNLHPMGRLEHWNYHSSITMLDADRFKKFVEAGHEYWSSEEGRARKSAEMSQSIKRYWKSLSPSEREEKLKRMRKTSYFCNCDMHEFMSQYWKNLSPEEYQRRCEQNNIILNGEDGSKASKRIKNYWKNLDPEVKERRLKQVTENLRHAKLTDKCIEARRNTMNSLHNREDVKRKIIDRKCTRVLTQLVDRELDLTYENFSKLRVNGDPGIKSIDRVYGSFSKMLETLEFGKFNHKVVSIRRICLDTPEPVYDISVGTYHNFYVSAGVMLHNCYRFAFWSTKYGYKYGKPQNQPTKVTNPHDDKGAMCKHITSLLANKRWMVRVASVLNEYIRANPEQVRKSLGLEEDEFIVNLSGIHTPKVKPIPEPEEQEDEMEQEPEDVDTEIDTDIGEGEEDNG